MTKLRIIEGLLLTVFFSSAFFIQQAQTYTVAQDSLSILVYTQYADISAGGEFANTLTAINASYGASFIHTNLTDYNNLEDELLDTDVFLILEQELAPDVATLMTIGTLWASTLQNFVSSGGVVITTDCYSFPARIWGPNIHILNESGLMTINRVEDSYPTGSISLLSLFAAFDPVAIGVSSSWTPSNGTISVETAETTVVAKDDNGNPVVIHKIYGIGHVVYCGFDFYISNSNYETILGNALSLRPLLPSIPGFPIEAIITGLVICFGCGAIIRRRREMK
ncbi:MAG: Loki-CTERM sorting domain-containing protein [Promethearchaeota archaeon]